MALFPRRFPLYTSLGAALALGALLGTTHSAVASGPAADWGGNARVDRSAFGRSGKLRAIFVQPDERVALPLSWADGQPFGLRYAWQPLFGSRDALLGTPAGWESGLRAPTTPGIWRLRLQGNDFQEEIGDLALVTRVPFARKQGGYVNGYFMGRWSTENGDRRDQYAPPKGFIEVTAENQELQVSEHFRLRQFLTKDQFRVWPKYLALDLRLIDKLELVMQELNSLGIPAKRMYVMSGFRTPQYNEPGVGAGGRAKLSRHTYGDAADVWIDNDSDGYIDDLNGDGRRDAQDAAVMLHAVDRVEARHPEMIGGAGLYRDNGAHGPFIHIDVRGSRARW